MNAQYEKLLDALKKSDGLTAVEIKDLLDLNTTSRARWIINELRELGYPIRTVEEANGYKYVLDDSNEDQSIEWQFTPRVACEKKRKLVRKVLEEQFDYYKKLRQEIEQLEKIEPEFHPDHETLVILNSDWHIGKLVTDDEGNVIFNTEIAKKRIDDFAIHLKQLIKHIRAASEIDEIVILNLGDLIDGESVYEHQAEHLEEFLVKQVEIATRQKWKQIEILRKEFKVPIREEFVWGNHGQLHISAAEATNFDNLVQINMGIIRDYLGYEDVYISPKYAEMRLVDVRGHRILMRHFAPRQTETSSAFSKFSGWLNIYHFDAFCTAHWHHVLYTKFQTKPIFRNGWLVGEDEYGRSLGLISEPEQFIFGVSDKRVGTFKYCVDLK